MSSKISANRRLEELSNDNEREIDERDESSAAWFFANKQLKMEIQIEALEDEVQDLEDERDDKDEEIEKLKEENKELTEKDHQLYSVRRDADICEITGLEDISELEDFVAELKEVKAEKRCVKEELDEACAFRDKFSEDLAKDWVTISKLKEENLELRLWVRRNQDEIDRLREILG